MFAFIALLFILLVIYSFTSESTEGFSSPNMPTNIPPPDKSTYANLKVLPGKIPSAPYQQIAAMSPLPYQNTTLIKANRQQLINTLELLKGFLSFEAQEISERSDPTVQLPLTTARSDFHVLQSEVNVLNRNPGLQSTLTLSQLNDISSNLAYLQREVRLIGANKGTLQGPYNIEGFELQQAVDIKTENDGKTVKILAKSVNIPTPFYVQIINESGNFISPEIHKQVTSLNEYTEIYKSENFTEGMYIITSNDKSKRYGNFVYKKPEIDAVKTGTNVATKAELEDFIVSVQTQIVLLSGTTDPVTNARINGLTKMKQDVQDVVDKLNNNSLQSNNVPIMKSDIANAFKSINDMSQPLPQIVKILGLPMGLSNLLPQNVSGDPEMMGEMNKLLNKYGETIANGLSGSISIKYTSPREVVSTVDKTGFPSADDLNACSGNSVNQKDGKEQKGQDQKDQKDQVTDVYAQNPKDAGRGPSHFDWERRSKDIESQVRKRGLNPDDFGVMPLNTKVSNDFCWKGYARMMCTRLEATTDPALPETCGCPPMDWKGWRISK